MSRAHGPVGRWLAAAVLFGALSASAAPAAGTLRWRSDGRGVDADVDGWPLASVLEAIAAQSRWDVYVEPSASRTITARFERLRPPDALRRLLDGLDFALLPQVRGPSKLFVYESSVGAATRHVVQATRPAARGDVANELLVVMKRGGRGRLERLARRLGADVVGGIASIDAYRLRLPTAAATRAARAKLAADPDVDAVEPNRMIGIPAVIDADAAASPAPLGFHPDVSPASDRVLVGLIDTAVQPSAGDVGAFLEPGVALDPAYQPPSDRATHGTIVARTILDGVGIALADAGDAARAVPLAILPVDVYGAEETTDTFKVAQGLEQAFGRHVNVVNMSLGGAGDSAVIQRLIEVGRSAGVLFFAAAGNEPTTQPFYPAADAGVVAVTAADAQGNVAPYANRGDWIDAMAPGTDAVQLGDRTWSAVGTSIATGWVTGWAAGSLTRTGDDATRTERLTLGRWGVGARR